MIPTIATEGKGTKNTSSKWATCTSERTIKTVPGLTGK